MSILCSLVSHENLAHLKYNRFFCKIISIDNVKPYVIMQKKKNSRCC